MKCGKLSKDHKDSGVHPSENMKYSPCPETQNKMASSSKGVELMVGGLDHWFSALQIIHTTACPARDEGPAACSEVPAEGQETGDSQSETLFQRL